ncbi:V-type ATP synthase subunit K [Stygiolobus caldivivus]|uniref:ATP synthase subunit K n=1 Tax=Stygiolobus caldivivus TaxID=2824673 RepID=A0A8D5U834_9CREN|nr:V-type ATP synthase subunit K [Stygiolobus caldivivus]BCU71336.1 ATP synthase subunit K [Stygiolobus caldivivus]
MRKILLASLLIPILVATLSSAQTGLGTELAGINIGAGLAIGLAAVGAGVAVGMAAAAGIGVLTERRDMFGTILIFVAIGEGIAVYGILFAILMLFAKV